MGLFMIQLAAARGSPAPTTTLSVRPSSPCAFLHFPPLMCTPFAAGGGKVSDFEGGVRVVAFMSGGALPQGLAGGKRTGMMHIADIHATICTPPHLSHRCAAAPGSDC